LLVRLLAALAILAVLAVGFAAWLGYFTDVCSVEHVEITGNRILDPAYIRQLSGVDAYENLLRVPVGRLQRNLERDPWIKKAIVGRHLLDTVRIDVSERVPVALVDTGGSGFLVDGSGYVIAGIATDQFPELPRVYAAEVAPPSIGEKLSDPRVAGCVEVIGSMPQALRDTLAMGNPFDGRGQVFVSRNGYNIIYGEVSELERKNEILEAIVTDVDTNNRVIAYIDIRVPDSPVIMPR
jgi:cell division protein FtsQ